MASLKKLVLVLLISLLLACMVMWGMVRSLKPEAVKAYIHTQLQQLTGQPGTIEGDVSWHIFPRPRIKITHIQIGDSERTSPFALTIDNLLLNLKITQLLRGNLVFSELNVDGFTVQINAQAANTPTQNKPSPIHQPLASQFAIKHLMLTHGKLIWTREQNQIILTGLQLGAEQFNLHQQIFPFQLKSKVVLSQAGQPVAQAQLLFKGNTQLGAQMPQAITLQSIPLFGQLTLQEARLQKLKIDRMQANTTFKNGLLMLNPLTLSLYRGESIGDLRYDSPSHRLFVNQTATNLDAYSIFHALFDKKLIKGRLDFSLHSDLNLQTLSSLQAIQGSGNMTIKEGTLIAIDLNKMIDETNNRINALFINKAAATAPDTAQPPFDTSDFFKGNTDFKLLTSQYRVENGLLHSDLFVLQTNRLQLKGDAQMNLVDYALNGALFAKVLFNNEEASKIQQRLGGAIPLLIQGTLMRPIILPDVKKIKPLLTQTWIINTLTKPAKQVHHALRAIVDSHA